MSITVFFNRLTGGVATGWFDNVCFSNVWKEKKNHDLEISEDRIVWIRK